MTRFRFLPRVTAARSALAASVLAGLLLASAPARADIAVQINIGSAPPPPRLYFRARPHERFEPGENVYIVDDPGARDYDCFRYGGYYWIFRDGYWYRSPSWRRGFVVVEPSYVPAVFYRVPPSRWKHHPSGPPRFEGRERGRYPGHMEPTGGHPGAMPIQPGRPPGARPMPPARPPAGNLGQGGSAPPRHMNPPEPVRRGREVAPRPAPPAGRDHGRGKGHAKDDQGHKDHGK